MTTSPCRHSWLNLQIKIFWAVCTHISCPTQKSSWYIPHAYSPRNFLHSAWPLYLSLPRNQCMIMINERIACPEISKGFIRVQSRWCFYTPRNLCLQFSNNQQSYFLLHTWWIHIQRKAVNSRRSSTLDGVIWNGCRTSAYRVQRRTWSVSFPCQAKTFPQIYHLQIFQSIEIREVFIIGSWRSRCVKIALIL